MNMRETAAQKLRNAGIRASIPRIVIFEYLLTHYTHPAAETIYRDLLPKNKTLSLTTVYNTLKLFEEKGLVRTLTIEDNELRYDVNTSFHAHFKCRKCGRLFDLDFKNLKDSLPVPDHGFEMETVQLDYYGLCPDCSAR